MESSKRINESFRGIFDRGREKGEREGIPAMTTTAIVSRNDGNDVNGNDSNDDDDGGGGAPVVAVGTYRPRQWGATGLVADERMEAGRIRVNGIS